MTRVGSDPSVFCKWFYADQNEAHVTMHTFRVIDFTTYEQRLTPGQLTSTIDKVISLSLCKAIQFL